MERIAFLRLFASLFIIVCLLRKTEARAIASNWQENYYVCVRNCAQCVTLWEPGLYNGGKCVDRCSRHRGKRIVDPSCANMHFFNLNKAELDDLRRLRKTQRKRQIHK